MKIATFALFASLVTQQGEAKITKQKYDFIRKMRESEKVNGPIRMSKRNLAEFLRRSEQVGSTASNKLGAPRVDKDELERRLNYYNDYQKFASSQGKRATQDENNVDADDGDNVENHARWWWWFGGNNSTQEMYADDDGDEASNYNVEGFADLSLKYAGCSSVNSISSDNDQDGNAIVANNLIQYRLCPTDSCQDDSWEGCRSEYGEYMMSLADFLDSQTQALEEELHMVCKYCDACESFNNKYCENDHCCTHGNDCGGYDAICAGEGDDDTPAYDELFDCKEVQLDYNSYYDNGGGGRKLSNNYNFKYIQGSSYYNNDGSSSVYVGAHCNGMAVQLGIFADNACTTLIATEDQVDIAALTGINYNTGDIENIFVPQGCYECGGDDYNMKSQWWYVEDNKNEDDDYQNVNEVCYNMYEASAKCNTNLGEDVQELLEESEDEYANENATCDFIKQAITGHIDENGFVLTDEGTYYNSQSRTGAAADVPVYGSSNSMSAGQGFALTFGMLGTATMAGAVYYLRQQLEVQGRENLMPLEDKNID